MVKSQSLPIGTVLNSGKGEYRIQSVLGQGGFGITYLATSTIQVGNIPIETHFAIKEHYISSMNERKGASVIISNDNNVAEVKDSIESFLVEAQRLNRLSLTHAGLVRVNESFRANDTAYYVMEYVKGHSLREYVRKSPMGRLAEKDAIRLFRPIAESISCLHDNKITHLDIKPDNILIRENGEPVVIDFGLSKHYDTKGKPTSTLKIAGCSAGYSPMEQYVGINTFTPEADVYALAATLLYMLTGKDPMISTEINADIIRRSIPADIPAQTADVIVRAMEKLKENRTHSVPDMLKSLEDYHAEGFQKAQVLGVNETKRKEIEKKGIRSRLEEIPKGHSQESLIKIASSLFPVKRKSVILGLVIILMTIVIFMGWAMTKTPTSQSIAQKQYIDENLDMELLTSDDMRKDTVITNLVNNMIKVEGGSFNMGGDDGVHQVIISSFFINKYEVSQEEWKLVMGNNPSNIKGAKLPVTKVSWEDCQTFIKRLNIITEKNFRLPTEAEWQYAAGGGVKSHGYYYSGSNNIHDVGWTLDSSSDGVPHTVGIKAPNELGLYDMSGNVYEWCSDWFGAYNVADNVNPTGPSSGAARINRGGAFYEIEETSRIDHRSASKPTYRGVAIGFRLAMSDEE